MTKVYALFLAAILFLVAQVPVSANELTIFTFTAGSRTHVPPLIEEFKSKYPDIQVNHVHGSRDDLVIMVLGGSSPDVAEIDHLVMRAGVVQSLDPYVETSDAVRALRSKGGLHELLWNVAYRDGSYDGQFSRLSTLRFYQILGTIMNVDMFNEAGLEAFDSERGLNWNDAAAAHQRLTRVEPDGRLAQIGFDLRNMFWFSPNRIAWAFGVDLVDAAANRPTLVNLEGPLQFLHDNFSRPTGIQDFYGLDGALGSEAVAFRNRQSAVRIGNVGATPAARAGGLQDELRATWMPTQSGERLHYVGGQGWGVPVGAPNLENAYRFLDYTFSEDWQHYQLEMTGQVGVHVLPDVAADPQRWLGNTEQTTEWFYTSLALADRYVYNHAEGLWWEFFEVQEVWMEEYDLRRRAARGNEPFRTLLLEADRLVTAAIASAQNR